MKNNIKPPLLIWPPFVANFEVPLGLPSLLGYLESHGIEGAATLDMNLAYIKRNQPFWWLFSMRRLLRRGRALLDSRTPVKPISAPATISTEQLLRTIHARAVRAYYGILKRSAPDIPWSVNAIVETALGRDAGDDDLFLGSVLKGALKVKRHELIGVSAMYPEQLFFALRIARLLKGGIAPNANVVVGGAQITKHLSLIERHPAVDRYVDRFVQYDGEEPLRCMTTGNDHLDRTETVPPSIADLPPPDFSGFDLKDYQHWLPVVVSRGCYWSKCSFCSFATMHGKRPYEKKPVSKTVSTLRALEKRFAKSHFRFEDDCLPPTYMHRLAERLLDEHRKITWECRTILSRYFLKNNRLNTMRASGLATVNIGLESISPRVLGLMNKPHKHLDEKTIETILTAIRRAGIGLWVNIMVGFPGERIEDAERTLDFMTRTRHLYDRLTIQPFCLEGATPIFNQPDRFGIIVADPSDRTAGQRLGYAYKVRAGMTHDQARVFTRRYEQRGLVVMNAHW